MNKVELLAEAFNLDSLKLNIENGCDAVYIGDELKNFSIDELKKSVEYAHNRDKKVYVSLNKIPHENDINEIEAKLADAQNEYEKINVFAGCGQFKFCSVCATEKQFTKRPCRRECRCNGGTCG